MRQVGTDVNCQALGYPSKRLPDFKIRSRHDYLAIEFTNPQSQQTPPNSTFSKVNFSVERMDLEELSHIVDFTNRFQDREIIGSFRT